MAAARATEALTFRTQKVKSSQKNKQKPFVQTRRNDWLNTHKGGPTWQGAGNSRSDANWQHISCLSADLVLHRAATAPRTGVSEMEDAGESSYRKVKAWPGRSIRTVLVFKSNNKLIKKKRNEDCNFRQIFKCSYSISIKICKQSQSLNERILPYLVSMFIYLAQVISGLTLGLST